MDRDETSNRWWCLGIVHISWTIMSGRVSTYLSSHQQAFSQLEECVVQMVSDGVAAELDGEAGTSDWLLAV